MNVAMVLLRLSSTRTVVRRALAFCEEATALTAPASALVSNTLSRFQGVARLTVEIECPRPLLGCGRSLDHVNAVTRPPWPACWAKTPALVETPSV